MYLCPVCKEKLKKLNNTLHCCNGHCFDIAKKGYVNLLTTAGRNPKNAGDNPEMVKARTEFLDKGYYLPLAEKTAEIMSGLVKGIEKPVIIDSGCGEGFYTCVYAEKIPQAQFCGIDISKNAVAHCMTRVHMGGIHNCEFAVASSFELPFRKGFADCIVCTFAPVANDEYALKLKKGGKLVVVSPSPRHLFELKSLLYEKPYENKPNVYGLNKFRLADETVFEYTKHLSSAEDIWNLFTMTPYFYKTSKEASEKLKSVQELDVTCGFVIQTYEKK